MNEVTPLDHPSNSAPAYELAYQEGVRALSEQQTVIENFRTRAGLLLSGAAIATSFLGNAAIKNGTGLWIWIAVLLFVSLGASVVLILWPRRDWEYAVRPELVIENYIEHPEPLELPQIHRDLALHMDRSYLQNRGQILLLIRYFRLASVLLMLEIVAWVVELVRQS